MVGDDSVDIKIIQFFDDVVIVWATVNCDDQSGASILGFFDDFWAHTVAVGKAVRKHDGDVFRFDADERQCFFH